MPDKPVRPAVFDFGPGLATPAPAAAAQTLPPLLLADIEAPAAVDGTAVLFRLAYADVQQLRPYAHARWSMPPAQLVRQRLRDQLSQQRVVLSPAEGPASLVLRLELEEFTQVFEAPERSVGLVRLRATAGNRGRARAPGGPAPLHRAEAGPQRRCERRRARAHRRHRRRRRGDRAVAPADAAGRALTSRTDTPRTHDPA